MSEKQEANRTVELQAGSAPWRPSDASILVAQYNYFSMPLAGVIGQGDREFFFECIEGQADDPHHWVYLPLFSADRARIEAASFSEFTGVVDSLDWSEAVFAVATDRDGLVEWNTYPCPR